MFLEVCEGGGRRGEAKIAHSTATKKIEFYYIGIIQNISIPKKKAYSFCFTLRRRIELSELRRERERENEELTATGVLPL